HRGGASGQHYGCIGDSQNRRTGGVCNSKRPGEPALSRRSFLKGFGALSLYSLFPEVFFGLSPGPPNQPEVQLVHVTKASGLDLRHNSGGYGGKLLPETLGSGCALFDYDADGWQDILLVNGMDWPGHKRQRSTLKLYHNNRNGTFTDVTAKSGLDV